MKGGAGRHVGCDAGPDKGRGRCPPLPDGDSERVHLEKIRRYPVKAMGGEYLDSVVLDERGLIGDRWFAVREDDGRFAACKDTRRFRRRDVVTRFDARTDADGEVWVDDGSREHRVGDPDLDVYLSRAMGTAVTVAPEDDIPHQDAGQVSLVGTASLDWCARTWGVDLDLRRLRPNLVIDTDEPFVEDSWIGHRVTIGQSVTLRVKQRVPRCRTVDVAQDGTNPRHRLLPRLANERNGLLAIYADVVTTGAVSVGDALDVTAAPPTEAEFRVRRT